jgi:hypothetical protein
MRIEELKARIDPTEVIGRYTKLRPAGGKLQAVTNPLREERTSSLFLYPDTGRWYDFGTGEGGDVIDFIERAEGLDRKGALSFLQALIGKEPSPREPIREKAPTVSSTPLETVRREWNAFETFDYANEDHRAAFLNLFPPWLYEEAHRVDLARFEMMARYDRRERCIVAGCFDESFHLIGYKWRRRGGVKWRARKGTHPNRSLTLRTLRTRPGTLHVIEGHRDALAAPLIGLNWVMLPTASWKITERGKAAVMKSARECGGHSIRFWVEDTAAYKAMRSFAEVLAESFEVSIGPYPGVSLDHKTDLSDWIAGVNSQKEALNELENR